MRYDGGGAKEPGRATVGITEPVKGNGKVMPWETKKGWAKAKQVSRLMSCQEPAAGATKNMKPNDHRRRTEW